MLSPLQLTRPSHPNARHVQDTKEVKIPWKLQPPQLLGEGQTFLCIEASVADVVPAERRVTRVRALRQGVCRVCDKVCAESTVRRQGEPREGRRHCGFVAHKAARGLKSIRIPLPARPHASSRRKPQHRAAGPSQSIDSPYRGSFHVFVVRFFFFRVRKKLGEHSLTPG